MSEPHEVSPTTAPRPFVFVLMPFDPAFDDVYAVGIKEAADRAGAYAERVDDQIYGEGILERVFNQINKADVIVADMTGKSPNVYYEVGYAHALGKIVILLTQRADDIPFDLKHRRHIVYAGRIADLRETLAKELRWAIEESRKAAPAPGGPRVTVADVLIPEVQPLSDLETLQQAPALRAFTGWTNVCLINEADNPTARITHVYVLTLPDCAVHVLDQPGGVDLESHALRLIPPHPEPMRWFRVPHVFEPIPPGAQESFRLSIGQYVSERTQPAGGWPFRLRLHAGNRYFDYEWRYLDEDAGK